MRNYEELERKHLSKEYRSSVEKMDSILSKHFTEFGSSGQFYTKQDILNKIPLQTASKYEIEDFEQREEGEFVITKYLLKAFKGDSIDYCLKCQSTWVKEDHQAKLYKFEFTE